MILVLAVAFGAVLWVILWALGASGFDSGMLFLLILLGAATAKGLSGYLPGNQDPAEAAPDAAPYT